VTAALALTVTSAAIGCGALIGIEDGVADPGTSGPDATTIIDGATTETGAMDASAADTSTAPDATSTPGPLGKPGGDQTMLPCGGMSCAIPGQSCCVYRSTSQPISYSGVCAAPCAPPAAGTDRLTVVKCSGPSNCPSATPRCCYHVGFSSVEASCELNCRMNDLFLCDPGGTNQCAGVGGSCRTFSGSSMPSTWGYCG